MKITTEDHHKIYLELVAIIKRYDDKASKEDILALAANIVGKLLALQDQRRMTPEAGIEFIVKNIELGNQEAIDALAKTKGNA